MFGKRRYWADCCFRLEAIASAQQAPADFAATIKTQYNQNKGYIVASADKWPEDAYGWRPAGLETELRTFGQILVHIANENNQRCNRVLGQPVPTALDDTKVAYTKAEATRILKASFALCDPVFQALSNDNMSEMLQDAGQGGATMQRPRATSLIADLTHSNEQYGMIMVYFAMKGMVPMSHEGK